MGITPLQSSETYIRQSSKEKKKRDRVRVNRRLHQNRVTAINQRGHGLQIHASSATLPPLPIARTHFTNQILRSRPNSRAPPLPLPPPMHAHLQLIDPRPQLRNTPRLAVLQPLRQRRLAHRHLHLLLLINGRARSEAERCERERGWVGFTS